MTAALGIGLAGYLGSAHLEAQRFGGPGRAGAFGRGGPGGPGAGGVLGPMMLNRLDLSDSQRDRVREIVTSHRDEQRALDERARTARQALDAAIIASPLDEAAIRGKAADIAQVDADLAVARGRIYNEVLQALTSDQQQKLSELRTERQERMERRRQDRSERRENRNERQRR
jgi:Spy/CpxP family protein refolding chaperone